MINLFYDTETTGINFKQHSIHEIGMLFEVDGEIKEEFLFKVRPHEKAKITPEALKVCGVTQSEIVVYPPMDVVHRKIIKVLGTYVDKFDKTDKIRLIGFNNRGFDDNFFRMFFELNKDAFFSSWFWSDTGDVLVLASEYLKGERRKNMPSFKLHRVASELGIEVDKTKTHNALYDAKLTRKIYRIVTGIDFEI
jgi:DNA polymerase-3 subunit epsilon